MNRHIEHDIHDANVRITAATNNVLAAMENREIQYFIFKQHYPLSMIHEVMKKRGYKIETEQHYVTDSLCSVYSGENVKISVAYMVKSGCLILTAEENEK